MTGAQDLASGNLITVKLDGKTYAMREPDLRALTAVEQQIFDSAYDAVEAMPESDRKQKALDRLDIKFISGGAHKFGGSVFTAKLEDFSMFKILIWTCTNCDHNYAEFERLIMKDKVQLNRLIKVVSRPFFTLLYQQSGQEISQQQLDTIQAEIDENCNANILRLTTQVF